MEEGRGRRDGWDIPLQFRAGLPFRTSAKKWERGEVKKFQKLADKQFMNFAVKEGRESSSCGRHLWKSG